MKSTEIHVSEGPTAQWKFRGIESLLQPGQMMMGGVGWLEQKRRAQKHAEPKWQDE